MPSSAVPAPALVVLAAGMGSRYGGLKQIDPVGPSGEAILDYSVYDALRAGFSRVVFVIRRDIEQAFRASIGSRYEGRIAVDYAFQQLDDLPAGFSVPEGRTKPWGTAHAILAARNAVREPFAVINADDFYGAEGYRLLVAHLTSAAINPLPAENRSSSAVLKGHDLGHADQANPGAALKGHGSSQADQIGPAAVLKGHGFSRADKDGQFDGALAPEGSSSQAAPTHAMVGFILRNTLSDFGSVARGICSVSPEGLLESVVETTGIEPDGNRAKASGSEGPTQWLTGNEIVSMNMWGFQPEVFADLSVYFANFLAARGSDLKAECYLPAAVTAAIDAGRARVRVLASQDAWFGVTYREDRPRVIQSLSDLIAAGRYPEKLWA